jgi:5'-3' exonuclease
MLMLRIVSQRRRRNKKALTDKYKISGLNITPGTQFMREVREAVEYYACSRLQTSYKFR